MRDINIITLMSFNDAKNSVIFDKIPGNVFEIVKMCFMSTLTSIFLPVKLDESLRIC